MRVLKIGGNDLADNRFVQKLAESVAHIQRAEPVVLVHGGGRAIGEMHTDLGLPTIKVDGLRVTSARSLSISEMILSGLVNKRLVSALLVEGLDALGLSGVDCGLLIAQKKQHPSTDLGYVGDVVDVRVDVLTRLLDSGFVPVVSPISAESNGGQHYNINADEAATAIAAALKADMFDFISNVPGVLNEDNLIPTLSPEEAHLLMEEGVIYGGMIPKVTSALSALDAGVSRTRIVNLDGLLSDGGTIFKK